MNPGIRKSVSILALSAACYLGVRYLLPLLFPFLLGLGLALAAEPMVSFLHHRRVPRAVSAGIGVSMSFCFIAIAVMLLGAFLLRELRSAAGILPDLEQTAKSGISLLQTFLQDLTAYTPPSVQPLLSSNINGFFSDGANLLDRAVGYVLGLAGKMLGHVPDSALSLGTAVISSFLFSARLPRIKDWILQRFPREKLRPLLETLKRIKAAAGGWLLAQLKLMGVTFGLLLAGFLLLRISYAPLWALAVGLVDALPVLGTGTVLLPWALVCFLQGDGGRAVGLLGLYAVICLTRSMLEPKLVGRQLGLDPLLTLIALYAGYKLWGFGGMILAPLLAATALQLIHPRREDGF